MSYFNKKWDSLRVEVMLHRTELQQGRGAGLPFLCLCGRLSRCSPQSVCWAPAPRSHI